ncbi:MAG: ACP S-malonyltransferase [Myxococcota bacterium]|nr:ACP S-malonyltransferase [Myxococcota bacterium]
MLALLFPGQGSQEVGMGRDAWEASRAAREVFEAADGVLGFPLSRLCFEGPEEELRRTENQQPAILATSVALLRLLQEQGLATPAFVAGHSLGEYTALVASGSVSFGDAVRLVHARGRFMQEAVPEGRGAMAAVIGATQAQVEACCRAAEADTGQVVSPANYNAPPQTVIAGHAAAVERACARAREEGAKRTVPLSVSAPFHCAMMAPAAEKLSLELSGVRFADPVPPVMTNVEAAPNGEGARVASLLERQVTEPVRFVEMVQALSGCGVSRVLDVGPGGVLRGLVRRIDREIERANCSTLDEAEGAVAFAAEGKASK